MAVDMLLQRIASSFVCLARPQPLLCRRRWSARQACGQLHARLDPLHDGEVFDARLMRDAEGVPHHRVLSAHQAILHRELRSAAGIWACNLPDMGYRAPAVAGTSCNLITSPDSGSRSLLQRLLFIHRR